MANVTYGKFNLWQVFLMAKVIMANETEPDKLRVCEG